MEEVQQAAVLLRRNQTNEGTKELRRLSLLLVGSQQQCCSQAYSMLDSWRLFGTSLIRLMARRLQKQLNERRGLFQRHDSFSAKYEASLVLAASSRHTAHKSRQRRLSSLFLLYVFFFLLHPSLFSSYLLRFLLLPLLHISYLLALFLLRLELGFTTLFYHTWEVQLIYSHNTENVALCFSYSFLRLQFVQITVDGCNHYSSQKLAYWKLQHCN